MAMKESVIKWQTGEPYESGNYLVTMKDGTVSTLEWYNSYFGCKCWVWNIEDNPIIAWCKLSDIESYKE
jgi:hypothetical protein